MASEEKRDGPERECVHKTKVIQFLGRTTSIVLQNENGPCPLLSICNVLLLENNLNLSPDLSEVSQEKLLSLVAERLIDANSNDDMDSNYMRNQRQNISDAIDLLPRLTTGIDVNLKFTGIRDFEFTPECAIFDLLDIPLYHGWIVDPQDCETAEAVGSKSYNRIMSELVSLETCAMDGNHKNDFVDFSAATMAALGIPSPSFSRGRSVDESPHSVAEDDSNLKKGDLEEEAALLRALKLSEDPYSSLKEDLASPVTKEQIFTSGDMEVQTIQVGPFVNVDEVPTTSSADKNGSRSLPSSPLLPNNCENQTFHETTSESILSTMTIGVEQERLSHEMLHINNGEYIPRVDGFEKSTVEDVDQSEYGNVIPCDKAGVNDATALVQEDAETSVSLDSGPPSIKTNHFIILGSSISLPDNTTSTSSNNLGALNHNKIDMEASNLVITKTESMSFSGRSQNEAETTIGDIEAKQPVHEGEEILLESGKTTYENCEPLYEGEVVLAEQADHGTLGGPTVSCTDGLTPTQGKLVQNFLRTNASQLSIYGLFCLQEGLKERELCVFFRNNHFNTMFKYEGELYLLATDQGYISQPDLVWEKLNEVNGNTIFMTSGFKEFKLDSRVHSEPWNEQNAMASTADFLSKVDYSPEAVTNFNSDLQYAIAIQQQEFDQQQQSQRPHNQQQQSTATSTSHW